MDMNVVNNLITSVGFPIFCVLALGWFIYKSYDRITQYNHERESKLYDIVNKSQVQLDKLEEVNEGFVKTLEMFTTDNAQMKKDIELIKEKVLSDEQ